VYKKLFASIESSAGSKMAEIGYFALPRKPNFEFGFDTVLIEV